MKKSLSILLSIVLILGVCGGAMLTVSADEPTVWDGTANIGWYVTGDGQDTGIFEIGTAEELAGLAKLVNASNPDSVYDGVYYDADYNVLGYRLSGKTEQHAYKVADKVYTSTDGDGSSVVDGCNFVYMEIHLTADIVLNTGDAATWATSAPANVWEPIGLGDLVGDAAWASFEGTFDGEGHTVSGMYFKSANATGWGGALFGYTGKSASVYMKNLTVSNFYVNSTHWSAGIIGRANKYTSFENCHVQGIIEANGQQSGALLGRANACDVLFSNCSSNVAISSTDWGAGGMLGSSIGGNITVENCSVAGSLSATSYASGIMGASAGGTLVVENCYSTATIASTAEDGVAGVIYSVKDGAPGTSITNYYYVDSITSLVENGVSGKDAAGVTAVTLDQLTGEAAKTTLVGFDFDYVWATVADGTPVHDLREPTTDNGGSNNGGSTNGGSNNGGSNNSGSNNSGSTTTEEKETDKKPAKTTEAATTDAAAEENKGCGSVVGFAGVALIAVLSGAALTFKKED